MPTTPEPKDWTEVGALFESLQNDIRLIAESMADIQPRVVRIERTGDAHTEEIKLLRAAIQTLVKDAREIKDRLSSAEARLP